MIKVGCCGYPTSMKKYYEIFRLVELNSTFYRYPKTSTVLRWRQKVPQNFEFTARAHQEISDKHRFKIEPSIKAFEQMKKICDTLSTRTLLIQTPGSLRPDKLPDAQEFFNGIDASRFNLSNHKAYVSVGFSNRSRGIYLQLRAQRMRARAPHDIAISNITVSATEVYIGQITNITFTIENEGNMAETFKVTAYAKIIAIQTKTVTNLAPGNQTTLTFTWSTTNLTPGNYTISCQSHPSPTRNRHN